MLANGRIRQSLTALVYSMQQRLRLCQTCRSLVHNWWKSRRTSEKYGGTNKPSSFSHVWIARKSSKMHFLVWYCENVFAVPEDLGKRVKKSLSKSCQCLSFKWFSLQMIADPSGPATDLVVRLPITIGTIPLADSYQFYMQQMGPSINMPTPAVDPSAPPMPMPELREYCHPLGAGFSKHFGA